MVPACRLTVGKAYTAGGLRQTIASKHPELGSGFALLFNGKAAGDPAGLASFSYFQSLQASARCGAPHAQPQVVLVPSNSARLCLIETPVGAACDRGLRPGLCLTRVDGAGWP